MTTEDKTLSRRGKPKGLVERSASEVELQRDPRVREMVRRRPD